jgi:hypothetical protein
MNGLSRLAQHGAASKSLRALQVTAMALVAVFTIHGIDHLHRGLHFESALIRRIQLVVATPRFRGGV